MCCLVLFDTFILYHMLFLVFFFFFFNDTATTEIYTLSLHDALPIWSAGAATVQEGRGLGTTCLTASRSTLKRRTPSIRSEEHTSELQSRSDLVCRLLLEKKKKESKNHIVP